MNRSKSNTVSSNSNLNRSGIESSIICGEALYRDIYISTKELDRLEMFGDTKEKKIINYFAFKRDIIIQLYR